MPRFIPVVPLSIAAVLVLSACSGSSPNPPTPSESSGSGSGDFSSPAAELTGLGYEQLSKSLLEAAQWDGTLNDGSDFELAESIKSKVASGQPINYVISYPSKSIPLASAQYLQGYEDTLPIANSILPMTGKDVSPSTPGFDAAAQIAAIEAMLNTGQVDCLLVQPTDATSMTDITNKAIAKGIPVFTSGIVSSGNEISTFTQISINEGRQAAGIVVDWMEETGEDLKVFAVSGGAPTADWAQGRMQGFIEGITEAVPDATFVNDETNALSTTFDPAGTYDAYKAFLKGNPEVQFIENVDIGAEHANRAITDAGLDGEVFTIGWNTSVGQFDGIEAGIQVAALDQAWPQQSGFGALACAAYLRDGVVMPNTNELIPVTAENVAEAREVLEGFN